MGQNKKILVIEDNKELAGVLTSALHSENLAVLHAKDGEEGLATALAEHPNLILLDLALPKMDGITMLKKIRENSQLKAIPAVILTNLNDTQTIEQALESGAYDYLVKSDWNPKDLVKHVREKLAIN